MKVSQGVESRWHIRFAVIMLSKPRYSAIGYHGCSGERAAVVREGGVEAWPFSTGWLGPGIYFWDNDRSTAKWWAQNHYQKEDPSVIAAAVDITDGLDLTNVFGQNALNRLRNLATKDEQTKRELEAIEKSGFSPDGALINLALDRFERKFDKKFPCVRAPVHMNPSHETIETADGSDLITGFRLVILVYDRSIIDCIEVRDVD